MGNSASTLYLNDEIVWSNPAGLGHAFIKVRKHMHEDIIIDRMEQRHRLRTISRRRLRKMIRSVSNFVSHPKIRARQLADEKIGRMRIQGFELREIKKEFARRT
jgi:hypothetical protein